MITNPAVGVYPLVEKITMGEIKATTATSHKHVYGRINILRHIVNKYTVNTDDVPLEPVLGQAFMALKHREEDVRLVAYQLMFEMYKVIGQSLRGYCHNVEENRKNILLTGFDKIDQGEELSYDDIGALI